MNTLSITVRYRPIRIGWCLNKDDFVALREALKLTFTMWGGRYNPIIPVDDFEFASSLVRLFRVDVLWAVSADKNVKKFIEQFPYLPNPFLREELFVSYGNGELDPQLVDIYHPIRCLYEKHFKNNPAPDTTVTIYEWQAEDPLADVLLATFGSVPPVEVTGTDYLELLRGNLSAKTIVLKPNEPLPERTGNHWTISSFCHAFMRQHYTVQNNWDRPGFYVGSGNDYEDLVTFWNLRATGVSLMFFDPNQADRLKPKLNNLLDILRSRPKGRFESDNAIAIWHKDGPLPPDVSIFGQGLLICTSGESTWNGLNVKTPYMYFSEGSTLAVIGKGSSVAPWVSFQLPPKPFDEDTRKLYGQHFVVSVNPGIGLFGNESAALQTPYVPELNEFYSRNCYSKWERNKARVEPAGLGIISDATCSDLSLSALNVVGLVKQLFTVAGIDAQPSKPGLLATRLIQQMGGLQGCRVFKIGGVRKLLKTYGPDTPFNHQDAMREIGKGDPQNGFSSIQEYKHLFLEPRPKGTVLEPRDAFSYLLKRGVFRTGLEFDCPSCQLKFWVPLDDVRTEVSCEYCGNRFNVTPYLHIKYVWKYRRSGLFGRDDHQEGAIPVVLTLLQLHTTFHPNKMLYTNAMDIKPKSVNPIKFKNDKCETDFVVIVPRSDDGKISVAIGECKTRKDISDDDVYNLKIVADAFPRERFNVFVIFSKLMSFSQEELKRIRQLNNEYHLRVILFTNRELEPYLLYERTAQEFKINRHAVSFEDMAKITEQVFLQPLTGKKMENNET